MPIEHEAKILDIDPAKIRRRILDRGGREIGGRSMSRYVYDLIPGDPTTWLRLRKDGKDVTLTVKRVVHDGIDGTLERETVLNVGFAAANRHLEALGFRAKAYQESHRRSFTLEGASVEIDTWPMIPPYLEIEAASRSEVIRVAKLLSFGESQLFTGGSYELYKLYGIDLAAITDLRF
jgi:adenylate cyclase, class 2